MNDCRHSNFERLMVIHNPDGTMDYVGRCKDCDINMRLTNVTAIGRTNEDNEKDVSITWTFDVKLGD